jgi:hypothetical protein
MKHRRQAAEHLDGLFIAVARNHLTTKVPNLILKLHRRILSDVLRSRNTVQYGYTKRRLATSPIHFSESR